MLRKRLDNRGFSLLEVIVALAIMGVGFVTVLRLFSEGIRTLDYSGQYMKGITLASNKITELELMDFNVDTFSGIFANEENYRWELALTPYESTLSDPFENIFLVKANVKVLWSDLGKDRNVELVTIRTVGKNYSASDMVIAGTSKGERLKASPPASPQGPVTNESAGPAPAVTGMTQQNISGALTAPAMNISGGSSAPPSTAPQNISGAGGGGGISGAP